MPVLVYSLLRILLIVAAGAGLYVAGMRGLLLVVAAVLVGAALSYLLLHKFRLASAAWLQSRGRGHTRFEDRFATDSDAEDAELDLDNGMGSEPDAGAEPHSGQERDQYPQTDD